MSFSSVLQSLRKEAKVTQEDLAQNLGVSAQAVSKWENGSFPEGDLLPRIADFFHVSIDYLYGRAEKDGSIEQSIVQDLNEMLVTYQKSGSDKKVADQCLMEKIQKMLWAFHVGSWVENRKYYDRPESTDEETRMASAVLNDYGYSYTGLTVNRDFYLFLKQPEDKEGFGKYTHNSDDIREFFGFLADKTNMRILEYLYTLRDAEYARRETLIKAIGVSGDKIDKALSFLCSIGNTGNPPISCVTVVNDNGQQEKAYGINMTLGGLLFGLFTVADAFVNAPNGFSLQICNRSRQWVDTQ